MQSRCGDVDCGGEAVRTIKAAPLMLPPPPIPLLGRDYYVRLDTNDYSVDPTLIGSMVDVAADLGRVRVRAQGRVVAEHVRVWAGGTTITTLEDFDFDAQPAARQQVGALASGGFLTEARNVVLLGPPGTGKTHLTTALGVTAARHGHRVLFATATDWVTRLTQAHRAGRLPQELTRLRRYGLIIVDEVGYLPSSRTPRTCTSSSSPPATNTPPWS